MTASELIDKLESTGTGSGKIVAARGWLSANPDADPHAMVSAMAASEAWPVGTMDKALKLCPDASGATTNSNRNRRTSRRITPSASR